MKRCTSSYNEELRAGIERELASRADQSVLRWFEHVDRMDDYRMARRVLMAEVSRGRVRGRPRLDWSRCVAYVSMWRVSVCGVCQCVACVSMCRVSPCDVCQNVACVGVLLCIGV